MNARRTGMRGVLLLAVGLGALLWSSAVSQAQQTTPGLTVSVAVNHAQYLFTGGPDPIQVTVAVQNVSGGTLIVAKSLTAEALHRTLTFIDPAGRPIVANDFGAGSHEGGPPPLFVVGNELIQVDPVVVLPPNASFTVTLPDARTFYTFTKAGTYRVSAAVPARLYPAVFRTTEDGTAYAQLETATFGGGLFSNTVEFALVADADGDGYVYPVPDARLSAQTVADCNDQNPLIHPGAPEIANDGLDNDCNSATTDDGTPPVTTAAVVPAPNANGWNKTAPTVVLTATDGGTVNGVASVSDTLTGASTGSQTVPGATATVMVSNQGTTTVSYFAKDIANNQEAPKTLLVKLDTAAPTLTVPAPLTVSATSPAGAVVTYTVTATDLLDPSPTIACTPPSGSTFPLGLTTVNCTATDTAGNSTSQPFTVTVTATLAQTERVSVSSTGTQGNSASGSSGFSVSADGRFVAFVSLATNLVASDTNGLPDVFVTDRLTHQTTRESVSSTGAQANGVSVALALSGDGRYVAFVSTASNLVAGDTNGQPDVFVRDRQTGQTTRVSVTSSGAQANGASLTAALSADGRYVAFSASASNLVPGDTNSKSDVFLHDRQTAQTTRVSLTTSGAQSTGDSLLPALSADGRYVMFASVATNLVAGDTNAKWDIFVRDRQTPTTTRVSLATGGAQGNGDSVFSNMSNDGRYVVFSSSSSNLVTEDTNGTSDVFLHDRTTATTTRVSLTTGGAQGTGASDTPAVSANGRYVAFGSTATNLVPGDTNGQSDVFVRDRTANQTARVSVSATGVQGNGASLLPALSSDGTFIGFVSAASNLVASDTNGTTDVILKANPLP